MSVRKDFPPGPSVRRAVREEVERARERRRDFLEGFLWGVLVLLFLIDLIRKFSERESP